MVGNKVTLSKKIYAPSSVVSKPADSKNKNKKQQENPEINDKKEKEILKEDRFKVENKINNLNNFAKLVSLEQKKMIENLKISLTPLTPENPKRPENPKTTEHQKTSKENEDGFILKSIFRQDPYSMPNPQLFPETKVKDIYEKEHINNSLVFTDFEYV